MSEDSYPKYDTKGMPFRLLGNSGLRVPLFSLGGCESQYGRDHVLETLGRLRVHRGDNRRIGQG